MQDARTRSKVSGRVFMWPEEYDEWSRVTTAPSLFPSAV